MNAPILGLYADHLPPHKAYLPALAGQALNASVNGIGDPERTKADLIAELVRATGLSESMFALLRMQGLLP